MSLRIHWGVILLACLEGVLNPPCFPVTPKRVTALAPPADTALAPSLAGPSSPRFSREVIFKIHQVLLRSQRMASDPFPGGPFSVTIPGFFGIFGHTQGASRFSNQLVVAHQNSLHANIWTPFPAGSSGAFLTYVNFRHPISPETAQTARDVESKTQTVISVHPDSIDEKTLQQLEREQKEIKEYVLHHWGARPKIESLYQQTMSQLTRRYPAVKTEQWEKLFTAAGGIYRREREQQWFLHRERAIKEAALRKAEERLSNDPELMGVFVGRLEELEQLLIRFWNLMAWWIEEGENSEVETLFRTEKERNEGTSKFGFKLPPGVQSDIKQFVGEEIEKVKTDFAAVKGKKISDPAIVTLLEKYSGVDFSDISFKFEEFTAKTMLASVEARRGINGILQKRFQRKSGRQSLFRLTEDHYRRYISEVIRGPGGVGMLCKPVRDAALDELKREFEELSGKFQGEPNVQKTIERAQSRLGMLSRMQFSDGVYWLFNEALPEIGIRQASSEVGAILDEIIKEFLSAPDTEFLAAQIESFKESFLKIAPDQSTLAVLDSIFSVPFLTELAGAAQRRAYREMEEWEKEAGFEAAPEDRRSFLTAARFRSLVSAVDEKLERLGDVLESFRQNPDPVENTRLDQTIDEARVWTA
ncbi:MAG: hypothetical protein HYS56_00405, partial [Candidatus Omnitrophica bacterium]|nr:hypothetical protein [Candidatus Omnitrophota bacterium]